MWTFAHSTFKDDTIEKNTDMEMDEFTGGNIRGFGLPLARIYARYFGGDLTLKSMEGYGVDSYIYLPVLGSNCENLPQRVLLSPSSQEGNLASYFHRDITEQQTMNG
jgi:pyruvate dehydrogenase kinase 2/3/4